VALQLIATEVFNNWHTVTGGGVGLKGIPRPSALFASRISYYYLVLGITVTVHWLIARLVRSPLGLGLMAIRDNETKAMMMGLSPLPYKTVAFVLAAGLAGLAGSLYAHYMEYAHPDFFNFFVSVDIYLMVILGGAGTPYGPAVGVVIVELLRETLHEFTALRLLLFGALLIAVINFLPGGLLPPILGRFARRPPVPTLPRRVPA
jgi:ABC-type branched-subunit amino acid transport system permease subunit